MCACVGTERGNTGTVEAVVVAGVNKQTQFSEKDPEE